MCYSSEQHSKCYYYSSLLKWHATISSLRRLPSSPELSIMICPLSSHRKICMKTNMNFGVFSDLSFLIYFCVILTNHLECCHFKTSLEYLAQSKVKKLLEIAIGKNNVQTASLCLVLRIRSQKSKQAQDNNDCSSENSEYANTA